MNQLNQQTNNQTRMQSIQSIEKKIDKEQLSNLQHYNNSQKVVELQKVKLNNNIQIT